MNEFLPEVRKWLSAFPRKDYERPNNVDIPEALEAARKYFRKHRSAFFRDFTKKTKLDPDAASRAVWTLAWCGELASDTFETVRHCGFQTTLSDCYDLMNISAKIIKGRAKAEDVIRRMQARNMDPAVGR